MKLVATRPLQNVFLSLSDKELLSVIEHDFPDLSGSLLLLKERFEQLLGPVIPDERFTCPQCGTELELAED